MSNDIRHTMEFDTQRFIADLRTMSGGTSLREIAELSGGITSVSTLSRVERGAILDMQTFMDLCAKWALSPGNYFKLVTWRRE